MNEILVAADNLPELASTLAPNAGSGRLTRATTDAEAITGWLSMHREPKTTFDVYRKEAERLLLWCQSRGITLSGFLVEEALAYKSFLRNPQPTERWCLQPEPRTLPDGSPNPSWRDVKRVHRNLLDGSPNPAWRPFISGLSESAARHTETVLFGLAEYLVATGWLAMNVWRVVKTKGTKKPQGVERYLERDVWLLILDGIEELPSGTPNEIAHYQRARFVFRMLYLTGLRRAELVNLRTSHLKLKRGKWCPRDAKR